MIRIERKKLLERCKPDSPEIESKELMYYITRLCDYCDELEIEISRMCKTCEKCKLAPNGTGSCNNWVTSKAKKRRKQESTWSGWFG